MMHRFVRATEKCQRGSNRCLTHRHGARLSESVGTDSRVLRLTGAVNAPKSHPVHNFFCSAKATTLSVAEQRGNLFHARIFAHYCGAMRKT
jgi:hypothetical protein